MNKELIKIVKNVSGNVVSIGLDDELNNLLEQNMSILDLDIISLNKKRGTITSKSNDQLNKYDTKYKIKRMKNKKINIKKLRKLYNKKKVDYLLVNYEIIKKD